MKIEFEPIGTFYTDAAEIPRHWSLSSVVGRIAIDARYTEGLKDIQPGQRIVVLFYFHKSPVFDGRNLVQRPPHRSRPMGVFSICSPFRPNAIGLSVLEVTNVEGGMLGVKGADMMDGTPVLDIKPHIEDKRDCPSCAGADPAGGAGPAAPGRG
jgi:tRNA-Thr(GGU) m(6)t(6)A37 methyltransferase TsaA